MLLRTLSWGLICIISGVVFPHMSMDYGIIHLINQVWYPSSLSHISNLCPSSQVIINDKLLQLNPIIYCTKQSPICMRMNDRHRIGWFVTSLNEFPSLRTHPEVHIQLLFACTGQRWGSYNDLSWNWGVAFTGSFKCLLELIHCHHNQCCQTLCLCFWESLTFFPTSKL